MSRKKTKPEDIRNPENYFNRLESMEAKRTQQWQERIYAMEDSLEQNMEYAGFTYRYATNHDNDEFEKAIAESTLLGWIETIRDDRLYCAVKRLTERQ